MTAWAPRRFWTDVALEAVADGWEVRLDGRPVRTPGKHAQTLPTRAFAELVAEEWRGVGEVIRPDAMPATRLANSAIEKVAPQMAAVVDHLVEYGGTDLLCYRADRPEALVARQRQEWDPWLDWADRTHGARLRAVAGVMYVAQDADALDRLRAPLQALTAFELAAVHDLVTLPGSLVLGLAAADGAAAPARLWEVAELDHRWQAEQWGADDEAEAAATRKRDAFVQAAGFLQALQRA